MGIQSLVVLIIFKNGEYLSEYLDMNLFKAVKRPINFLATFTVLCFGISSITFIYSVFALVALNVIKYPRNFPSLTMETRLAGLSLMLKLSSYLKMSSMPAR